MRILLRDRDGSIRAYAVVDAADAEWASQWHWNLGSQGYAQRAAYRAGIRTTLLLHRELLGLTHGDCVAVDHIDRDKLHCRRANLRCLRPGENSQNIPKYRGVSRYRGVFWNKEMSKWQAAIRVKGKAVHLGLFLDEDEAGRVALEARQRWMPFSPD